MAEKVFPRGHLVAVDGSRGKDVSSAADALAERLRRLGVECVISRWDASGLFGELAQAGRPGRLVSPRTLSLVYAADLAFRLRWEIRPALAEGQTVVAAPYVETAVAFGRAAGVPMGWLVNLFRFAPRPAKRCFVHGSAKRGKAEAGFVGFGCDRMRGKPGGRTPPQILKGTAAELRRMARRSTKVRSKK